MLGKLGEEESLNLVRGTSNTPVAHVTLGRERERISLSLGEGWVPGFTFTWLYWGFNQDHQTSERDKNQKDWNARSTSVFIIRRSDCLYGKS